MLHFVTELCSPLPMARALPPNLHVPQRLLQQFHHTQWLFLCHGEGQVTHLELVSAEVGTW